MQDLRIDEVVADIDAAAERKLSLLDHAEYLCYRKNVVACSTEPETMRSLLHGWLMDKVSPL